MRVRLEVEERLRPFLRGECGCGKWKRTYLLREALLEAWDAHIQEKHVRGLRVDIGSST